MTICFFFSCFYRFIVFLLWLLICDKTSQFILLNLTLNPLKLKYKNHLEVSFHYQIKMGLMNIHKVHINMCTRKGGVGIYKSIYKSLRRGRTDDGWVMQEF